MLNRFLSFTLFAALTLWGAVAFAAELLSTHGPAAPSAVDAIGSVLTGTVFPVITALFMGVFGVFMRKLTAKYHLDGLLRHQEFLEKVALQGITMAEERAAAYAKNGLAQKLNGREKLAIAVNHICDAMPKVSDEQAKSIVNSLLARIPGVGATGDTAIALGGSSLGVFSTSITTAPAAEAAE